GLAPLIVGPADVDVAVEGAAAGVDVHRREGVGPEVRVGDGADRVDMVDLDVGAPGVAAVDGDVDLDRAVGEVEEGDVELAVGADRRAGTLATVTVADALGRGPGL